LPSKFAGGSLELRHDGQTKHVDLTGQSLLITSVVAFYSGVEQTLSAVSGFPLCLVYDIVHRGARPPTLANLDTPKQKMLQILESWARDTSGHAPQFLACLLHNKYPHSATFDACALVGDDEFLLSLLLPLVRDLRISLHFAHVEITVKADYSSAPEGDRSIAWEDFESIYMTEESFAATDDGDVDELVIIQVVDLDGIPVEVEGLHMHLSDLMNSNVAAGKLNEPDSEWEDVC
jgi:hypothetical protein